MDETTITPSGIQKKKGLPVRTRSTTALQAKRSASQQNLMAESLDDDKQKQKANHDALVSLGRWIPVLSVVLAALLLIAQPLYESAQTQQLDRQAPNLLLRQRGHRQLVTLPELQRATGYYTHTRLDLPPEAALQDMLLAQAFAFARNKKYLGACSSSAIAAEEQLFNPAEIRVRERAIQERIRSLGALDSLLQFRCPPPATPATPKTSKVDTNATNTTTLVPNDWDRAVLLPPSVYRPTNQQQQQQLRGNQPPMPFTEEWLAYMHEYLAHTAFPSDDDAVVPSAEPVRRVEPDTMHVVLHLPSLLKTHALDLPHERCTRMYHLAKHYRRLLHRYVIDPLALVVSGDLLDPLFVTKGTTNENKPVARTVQVTLFADDSYLEYQGPTARRRFRPAPWHAAAFWLEDSMLPANVRDHYLNITLRQPYDEYGNVHNEAAAMWKEAWLELMVADVVLLEHAQRDFVPALFNYHGRVLYTPPAPSQLAAPPVPSHWQAVSEDLVRLHVQEQEQKQHRREHAPPYCLEHAPPAAASSR